jgi:hypothetical protein
MYRETRASLLLPIFIHISLSKILWIILIILSRPKIGLDLDLSLCEHLQKPAVRATLVIYMST